MCRKVAGAELTVRVTIVTGVQSKAHGFERDFAGVLQAECEPPFLLFENMPQTSEIAMEDTEARQDKE